MGLGLRLVLGLGSGFGLGLGLGLVPRPLPDLERLEVADARALDAHHPRGLLSLGHELHVPAALHVSEGDALRRERLLHEEPLEHLGLGFGFGLGLGLG